VPVLRLQYLAPFLTRFRLFGGNSNAVVTGQKLPLAPSDMDGFIQPDYRASGFNSPSVARSCSSLPSRLTVSPCTSLVI
jgi:hypothetical protein